MLRRIPGSVATPDWRRLKGEPITVYYPVGIYDILDKEYYRSIFESVVSYEDLPEPEIFYIEISNSSGPHRDPAPQSVALNYIIESANSITKTWNLKNSESAYCEQFHFDDVVEHQAVETKDGEFWLLETKSIHSIYLPSYLKKSRKLISWRWSNIQFEDVLKHIKCTNK